MTTREILEQAVTAKIAINSADTETKNKALANMADELLAQKMLLTLRTSIPRTTS